MCANSYVNLLLKVQTKLQRETQVTESFPLTLPRSLIADSAFWPHRGMKLAFISKWLRRGGSRGRVQGVRTPPLR